jgi:threonine dehydrogenase-like Zn-dependent dehydrogenase
VQQVAVPEPIVDVVVRALVFEGPWKLAVEDRPEPQPQPDESLLRILSTGICGSDLHGFTGATGRRVAGQVMGHETVAEVLTDRTGEHPPGTIVTVNPLIGCGNCPACRRGAKQRCPSRKVIGVDPDISSAFAERMTAPSDRLVVLPAQPAGPGRPGAGRDIRARFGHDGPA